jgi:hypothetical protein
MKWWVESDFKAPNLPLSLRLKGVIRSVSQKGQTIQWVKEKKTTGKQRCTTIRKKNKIEQHETLLKTGMKSV